MKHSEFWQAVADTFGRGYGGSVVADLVLPGVGGRTAQQALDDGVAPGEVWAALCAEMELDESVRWRHRGTRPARSDRAGKLRGGGLR